MMKKLILSFSILLFSLAMVAQNTVTGKVVDPSTGEGLIGASVMVKGTATGALTDLDGMFSISALPNGSHTLVMSYLGYEEKSVTVNLTGGETDLGTMSLNSAGVDLESVVITGTMDIVRDRRTPVAVSTIGIREIQAKAGNVEFPELMKNTPSIYVANQAGGYGDSEVFTRGFDQTNTAFLLNGQPINGMEDGRMYWSNWSGMTDVATAVQVQRGLGSSKLAISSVGGTVNIIMRPTAQAQGGFVSYLRGNDNYNKATFMYNTGMGDNKFGLSVLLTHWQGDGWADGTKGQGQNYFISAGWKPSDKHELNFLVTGAPQWHDQNFTKRISDHYDDQGNFNIRFNDNWGFLDGEYYSERRNYYHKPVANLNWEYFINPTTSLSTVLYASWGRGGGTGPLGNFGNREYDENGQLDFDAIVANNQMTETEPGEDVYITRASVNNHQWFGVVSTLNKRLSESVNVSLGADIRRYTGVHFRQVTNFLGASGYAQSGRTRFPDGYVVRTAFDPNPWKATSNFADDFPAGERIAYSNDETITYGGVFGQIEYATDKISTFLQGAVSSQSHVRYELFNETEENIESEKVTNPGYNVKTGLSYLINDNNSVFFNTGYYSRQPFHDNIFLNFSNTVNPVTENENIFGLELGYKYNGPNFTANLNAYRTSWQNRTSTSTIDEGEIIDGREFPDGGFINLTDLDQLHSGVEFDFRYRATDKLRVKGYASIGSWEYDGTVREEIYEDNVDRTLVSSTDNLIVDGVKVGGAAQTTFGLGLDYEIISGLRMDLDWNYYDNLYANLSNINDTDGDMIADTELKLPSFSLLDFGVSYAFSLNNGQLLTLRANIYNVLGEEYISRSWTAVEASTNEAENWNGVNRDNRVAFGKTRTWNVSAKYSF